MNFNSKHYLVAFLLCGLPILISCEAQQKENDVTQSISAVREQSPDIIESFNIEFPESWEVRPNYQGTVVMGLSPAASGDDFRENVSVQVFNLNGEFDSKETAKYLFQQSIKYMDEGYEIISEEQWGQGDNSGAYSIDYSYSYNDIFVRSQLFCVVHDSTAYVLIGTAKPEGFEGVSSEAFSPIANSFSLRN